MVSRLPHFRRRANFSPQEFSGFLRFRTAPAKQYDLFFDRPLTLAFVDDEGEKSLDALETPLACDGITHRASFPGVAEEDLVLRLGAAQSAINMIVEIGDLQ